MALAVELAVSSMNVAGFAACTIFGGPQSKDSSILGFILGSMNKCQKTTQSATFSDP